MMEPVDYWKALSIVVFPLIVTTGISLSAHLGSKSTHSLWFTCGVLFSAGVLLSGGLVHMLPDANEMYNELLHSNDEDDATDGEPAANDGEEADDDDDFPLPNVVFGLTFLLLLAVEVAAHRFAALYPYALGNHHHLLQKHAPEGYSSMEEGTAEERYTLLCNSERHKDDVDNNNNAPLHEATNGDCISESCQQLMSFPVVRPRIALESKSVSLTAASHATQSQNDGRRGSSNSMHKHHDKEVTTNSSGENNNNNDKDKGKTSPWVAVLLLVVLSIHVLIEDVTLGSTQRVGSIRDMFLAIVFHKGFSAFALGSGLVSAGFLNDQGDGKNKRTFYLLCATFLAMDPLGIGIGWALSNVLPPESYTEAMLQAMLGGSFLFVSVIELIPGELEKTRNHGYSLTWVIFSLLFGFGAMTLLGLWL